MTKSGDFGQADSKELAISLEESARFFSEMGHFLVHYEHKTQELAQDPLSIRKISENDKITTFGHLSGVNKKIILVVHTF